MSSRRIAEPRRSSLFSDFLHWMASLSMLVCEIAPLGRLSANSRDFSQNFQSLRSARPAPTTAPRLNIVWNFSILRGYSNCCRASVPRRLLPFGRAIRNSAKKKRNSRGSIEPGLPKRPTASSRPAEARRISCRTARTSEHPSLVRSVPRLRGRTLPFFPPE